MYKILIFSKYISHKKEIKVNTDLTPDYVQDLIYPLVVLKFDPKEPSQNLLKISSKKHFLLHIILSALDNIQKLGIVLILLSRIAYIANYLGFSSILIFVGVG